MPKQDSGDPTVVVADPSEEMRMLLMQYVAIEWPNARTIEIGKPVDHLEAEAGGIEQCDMVVAGVRAGEVLDIGWLERMRASRQCPPVVAVVEGDPAAAEVLLENGVYCQYRDSMTTEDMRRTLRAALSERRSAQEMPDRTVMIDTGVLRGEPASHGARAAPSSRVQVRGYQLLKKLGQGGMSEVFLAQRQADTTTCALKVLRAEYASASVLELFIEECNVVSALESPYVVRIYEHGVTDDYLFVAMEHIQGGDLRERISLGIAPDEALDILQQLARALDAVHGAGLIHGDIKPRNVMFRDARSLVLVDFGVSRVMENNSAFLPGQIIGTPGYISPEHVLDQPIDGRSDLYSAGVLFYEMLTGSKPFIADSVETLLRMHVNSPPPPLPPALASYQPIVDGLLAKRPNDRFSTPAELLDFVQNQWPRSARR